MTDQTTATIHQLPPAHERPKPKRRRRKAEVVDYPGWTRLDGNPDRTLAGMKGELVTVLVVGETPDGMTVMASNLADPARVLWLLEVAKRTLLEPE
jgi:hypothetical protein